MLRRFFNFIGVAALGMSLLASTTTARGQGAPNVWQLQGVIVSNKANKYVTIVGDDHNSAGGKVRIAVDGHAQMQFNWQFTRDITRLTDGEAVPAQL